MNTINYDIKRTDFYVIDEVSKVKGGGVGWGAGNFHAK